LNDIAAQSVFKRFTTGKIEIGLDHLFHGRDIFVHSLGVNGFRQHGQLQFQACQRCTKVMRDACQHIGTLFDLPTDTVAHLEKSFSGTADFACASRAEMRRVDPHAEMLGNNGQFVNWTDLISHEDYGHDREDQSGSKHKKEKDIGLCAEQTLERNVKL